MPRLQAVLLSPALPGWKMLTSERAHFWSGGAPRSRSAGNLIDMEAPKPSKKCNITECPDPSLLLSWPDAFTLHGNNVSKATNPFWNELSASNPFLDDITQLRNNQKKGNISILKEDPFLFFREIEPGNSVDSSGDELTVHQLLRQSSSRKSARSKSVSELLDILDDTVHARQNIQNSDQILEQDLEWLQNDREAYKMAWLSQRQLARSCLDLNTISQSPGWAQTQVAETVVVCQLNHQGGSVQLPESDITVHVPHGHVAVGEFQEVSLRVFLDPPQMLNHDHLCTVSPLLEIMLGNLNTMEAILLEMKIGAEVRKDPFSQVMTEMVCLHSLSKEGPFKVLNSCYIYKDTIQVKLIDLSQVMYLVVAAQAKATQSPAVTIWDYIHKTTSVGIYGPKHIHPRFTTVFTVCGHSYLPGKLTISDIRKGRKNTSPVVFQLWGKHSFLLDKPQDLNISVFSCDPDFEVQAGGEKGIKQKQLQASQVVHHQFLFSLVGSREMHVFVFRVQLEPAGGRPVAQFCITTPDPAPNLKRRSNLPGGLQKGKEIKSAPSLPTVHVKYPTFQDKKLNFTNYGVTLKTVLRKKKIDYLLEYFKGDTIALLGEGKVKAIGQSKVKEWYVAVLRGKIGLVHCRNVKVIAKEQVMPVTDSVFTTRSLLEQIVLPFKKLTYIYSVVLTLVSEKVNDWKALADVLGYSHTALEDFDRTQADKESEKVSYLLKKLKEDCHADRNARRFLYELVVALLKMDRQGLVAHIIQEATILTSAVKLGKGWRELAPKLARLTKKQMEAYEVPHRGKAGHVAVEMMWKPAYDFLYTWGAHCGNSCRDVLQDLQSALDRMKNPVTKQWRDLTGALILVHSLELLRATAFSTSEEV
ncbi:metastasis-associated in colon cancer protein 1 isoform X1 [Phyllostomus hastatus]|uniref:metastasis-associated in colon cancer protein 1 isoform X1 n=2 Tax=Phyllostomus hastatus TaxID=9423 RepID=UPI001E68598C|nr:metastasis-associated in colon cancer protein 1 isoform X1 [Phyllostomus hastatus]XP_045684416.1 metastasis-associated in colon cancer protein 1 isoform X1 [Phyllostomus hastatus]XP_045684417.1 metastasis-associated in colon cancer protein 1 isoform X1 [Phyllostomus hastatus]